MNVMNKDIVFMKEMFKYVFEIIFYLCKLIILNK